VDLLVFVLEVPRAMTVSDVDRPELAKHFHGDSLDDW
jgi:hypothetical protein